MYTDKNAEVPLKWEDSDPRFIPNAETVKLRSFSTNVEYAAGHIMGRFTRWTQLYHINRTRYCLFVVPLFR